MYQQIYAKAADALVDCGYIVIENALDEALLAALSNLCRDESGFVQAGISDGDATIEREIRSNVIRWIDKDVDGPQTAFLEFMQDLQEYCNRHLFLGLNYYESHYAVYKIGDFYERHMDAFKNYKNRVLSTVLYLNEEWQSDDGGELLIYDEAENLIERVVPKMGTLVIFLSEKFPHEVLVAKKKRYGIAGWFRVDKI